MSSNGLLQNAAVIAKTTQTLVGNIILTENQDALTLFGSYTKGDETGVDIQVSFLRVVGGTEYPYNVWSDTAGVNTLATRKYRLTATGKFTIQVPLNGAVDFVKVTQGGSNNDGTPTGTLAMEYTLGGMS